MLKIKFLLQKAATGELRFGVTNSKLLERLHLWKLSNNIMNIQGINE